MKINLSGITLNYERSGQGPALVLLHGNGEDHSIFKELAGRLKAHFTVYAIDSRNHGGSTKTEDYSYEIMAGDLFAFIDTLSLGTVNLIGFSDGAIISLLLAMKHAECIRKMALLGPNLKPDDFTEESYRYLASVYEETGDPLYRLMLEQPDIELDDIRTIKIPALVVGGEDDIYKPETFRNITQALPDARLIIMQGHDHSSYIAHTDIMYEELMHFFYD